MVVATHRVRQHFGRDDAHLHAVPLGQPFAAGDEEALRLGLQLPRQRLTGLVVIPAKNRPSGLLPTAPLRPPPVVSSAGAADAKSSG